MGPWTMRNLQGRMVFSGGYIVILKLTNKFDNKSKTLITKLAVKEGGN
jgi:hypothetical protein